LFEEKLTESAYGDNAYFGYSVDISSVSDQLLVGAWGADTSLGTATGAAVAYQYSGGSWAGRRQELLPDNLQNNDNYGSSVAFQIEEVDLGFTTLSAGTALIGAARSDTATADGGAAFLFKQNIFNVIGGPLYRTYNYLQHIVASDSQNSDRFGISVAMSDTRKDFVIGAWFDDDVASQGGAVYMYTDLLETELSITPAFRRIQLNSTLDIGVSLDIQGLTSPDAGLANKIIQLNITKPDSSTVTIFNNSNKTDNWGEFIFTGVNVFDAEGNYQINASWSGEYPIAAPTSVTETINVRASPGYAVIIQGALDAADDISHWMSAERTYRMLEDLGYAAEDIFYFGQDPARYGVDAIPSLDNIEDCLLVTGTSPCGQTLLSRANTLPGDVHFFFVGEGSSHPTEVGRFYLNPTGDNGGPEFITPSDLSGLLNSLEGNASISTTPWKRSITMASCYSGSFVPALSAPNRIIMSSAAADELASMGLEESDFDPMGSFSVANPTRPGSLFLDEFVQHLGDGSDFRSAFDLAGATTESFSRANDDADTSQTYYGDYARQHPLLDDNADSRGSNRLSHNGVVAPGYEPDGYLARNLYLAFPSDQTQANSEFEVMIGQRYQSGSNVCWGLMAGYDPLATPNLEFKIAVRKPGDGPSPAPKITNPQATAQIAPVFTQYTVSPVSTLAGAPDPIDVSALNPNVNKPYCSALGTTCLRNSPRRPGRRGGQNVRENQTIESLNPNKWSAPDIWVFEVCLDWPDPGRYEIWTWSEDNGVKTSHAKRSVVYVEAAGNGIPIAPAGYTGQDGDCDGTETSPAGLEPPHCDDNAQTALRLDWEPFSDPENKAVSYNVIIRQDNPNKASGTLPVDNDSIFIEELSHSSVHVGAEHDLQAEQVYFWQVQAVDDQGGLTNSSIWSFETTGTNYKGGIIEGNIYHRGSTTGLDGALVTFNSSSVTCPLTSATAQTQCTDESGYYFKDEFPLPFSGAGTASVTEYLNDTGAAVAVNVALVPVTEDFYLYNDCTYNVVASDPTPNVTPLGISAGTYTISITTSPTSSDCPWSMINVADDPAMIVNPPALVGIGGSFLTFGVTPHTGAATRNASFKVMANGDEQIAVPVTQDGLPDTGDFDMDGITNGDELILGTDPLDADSDDDGLLDGNDAFPLDSDSDDDGVLDGDDAFPLDPSESVDTDGDGIGNNADLDDDNDGYSDVEEIAAGTDPLNASSPLHVSRFEFNAEVTAVSAQQNVPQTLYVGQVFNGHVDMDTSLAPPASVLGNGGDYDIGPAVQDWISEEVTLGGVTYSTNNFSATSGNVSIGDDHPSTSNPDTCSINSAFDNDASGQFAINASLDGDQMQSLPDFITGYGLDQGFIWNLDPDNLDPPTGTFAYSDGVLESSTNVSIAFKLLRAQAGPAQPFMEVDLSGTVKTTAGQDICAMVLASGQYMFSCDPGGEFSLTDLPRKSDGTVKRQIYADGFFPGSTSRGMYWFRTLKPRSAPWSWRVGSTCSPVTVRVVTI